MTSPPRPRGPADGPRLPAHAGRHRPPRAGAPATGTVAAGPSAIGVSVLWLSVIVLLPLAALTVTALSGGLGGFWDAVTAPAALAALRVTLGVSAVVALVNVVMGTLIAWVLVRDDFRGKSVVNASSTCRSPCRRSWRASCCCRCTGRTARSGCTSTRRTAGLAVALRS